MKVNVLLLPILLLLSSGSLVSCGEEDVSPNFTHEYFVSAISNPWGAAASDNDQLTADVVEYLDDKGIKVKDIQIGLILIQFPCLSGDCLTGQLVQIRVSNKGSEKLRELDEGWQRAG